MALFDLLRSGCRGLNPVCKTPSVAYYPYTTPRSPSILFASRLHKGAAAASARHDSLAVGSGGLLEVGVFTAPVRRVVVATQKLASARHN